MHPNNQKPFITWMEARGWTSLPPASGEEVLRFMRIDGPYEQETLQQAVIYKTGLMTPAGEKAWVDYLIATNPLAGRYAA
jgi:hypothetical protein